MPSMPSGLHTHAHARAHTHTHTPVIQNDFAVLQLLQEVNSPLSTVIQFTEQKQLDRGPLCSSSWPLGFLGPRRSSPPPSRLLLALALPHIALNQEDVRSGPQSYISFH